MTRASTIREQVFKLRKDGYSYSYISEKVGISKSTLSAWLSSMPYTPNKTIIDRIGKARAASGFWKAKRKLESIENAGKEAKKEMGKITNRDLFMLGIGIYIGEGAKTNNTIRVINADPKIIKFAAKWFEEACGLPKENFRLRLHLYPDNNIKECINFWSNISKIPEKQFYKAQIDRREDKKIIKKGKLPYGTAHLSIVSNGKKEFGVLFARKINAWMEEVLK
jgi:transcriptional regulator with XRE-family HTH domain